MLPAASYELAQLSNYTVTQNGFFVKLDISISRAILDIGSMEGTMTENKTTVLLIEDDKNLRLVMTEFLTCEGFEVHAAEDGMQGLKHLENDQPDVIICDVMMPNLDGFQFAQALKFLKRRADFPNTPLIFLSAHGDGRRVVQGIKSGCVGFLHKPHDVPRIADKVRELLAKAAA